MIEVVILDYLNQSGYSAYAEEEPDMPEEFIIIEKIGGNETNHIKKAVVAIKSYAGNLYRAMTINEKVKETMKRITALDQISKCSLNSDYNYTGTTRKKYRYQAVFDITYY